MKIIKHNMLYEFFQKTKAKTSLLRWRILKPQFDKISVFYRKNEKLILIPTGKLMQFPANVDIEPAFALDLPTTREVLENQIQKCFNLCWTSTAKKLTKTSVIEKTLGYKSYKKVVENYDYCSLTHSKKDDTYTLIKTSKSKNLRYYEGIDFQRTWDKIDYDFILNVI